MNSSHKFDVHFFSQTDKVNDKLKEVFTDVVDDFYRLSIIKTRFEQWKFSHTETYLQAYVPLCLPKLFTPYVIYQMIHWNPLDVSLYICTSLSIYLSIYLYIYLSIYLSS